MSTYTNVPAVSAKVVQNVSTPSTAVTLYGAPANSYAVLTLILSNTGPTGLVSVKFDGTTFYEIAAGVTIEKSGIYIGPGCNITIEATGGGSPFAVGKAIGAQFTNGF